MDRRRLMRILSVAAGVFALASVALGVANARHEKEALAQAESDRRASTAKILEPSKPSAPDRLIDRWGTAGFTGRYRLGPEACAIRIVMFTDYQCPDCKRIDGEIDQIMAGRSDVSLSVKQFPMCQDAEPGVPCNRYAPGNMHPNACWAARAAEAAGILYGDDGFWKMHRWLFQHAGSFSDAELKEGLAQLGFDPNAFPPVMNSPETLKRVRDDVEEGIALGLFSTPMIFVNGVEFKGWQTPGALKKTIDEVTAKNPPAEKATVDRPPLAEQKFLDDWREQPPRVMPYSARSWSMGADPAHPPKGTPIVYVLVFGDYQESFTAEMDGAIRDFVKSHPQVRYTFRHYPVNTDCNPTLPANVPAGSLHPLACRTAKAAEAAGTIGGPTAFWAMHAWLMANQKTVSDETIRAEARAIGLDEGKFAAAMDSPQVAAAITQDAQAGKQLGLSFVPMVFVNAKWVPRMSREDENIVIQILKEITAKK